jgi:hypothetical protein
MIGPGKYDDVCTAARTTTKAAGVILIVIGGERGSGFSCQTDAATLLALPDLLETLARQIRDDIPTT